MALTLVLVAPVLAGCGGKVSETGPTATGTLTAQELKQILTDSMLAVKNANTYGFSMDMKMNMEATGGTQAGKADITMEAGGVADTANMTMHFGFDMSMTKDVPGEDNSPQSYSAELYMVDNMTYMKMDVPGMGKQWHSTHNAAALSSARIWAISLPLPTRFPNPPPCTICARAIRTH